MQLTLNVSQASSYKSGSQRARVITESWALENLYCAACTSQVVEKTPTNYEASDFRCPSCAALFQLKAMQRPIGSKVADAGYSAMMRAVTAGTFPNLLVMRYDIGSAHVRDLILIPSFTLSPSAVIKRKPLAPSARRAGWVGCNISLDSVPKAGQIPMVRDSVIIAISTVRRAFSSLRVLQKIDPTKRGWTLDVLRAIGSIGREEFSLRDVYSCEHYLSLLHPQNRHVRPKIRQQLQVLRDLGLVRFLGRGMYQLKRV